MERFEPLVADDVLPWHVQDNGPLLVRWNHLSSLLEGDLFSSVALLFLVLARLPSYSFWL